MSNGATAYPIRINGFSATKGLASTGQNMANNLETNGHVGPSIKNPNDQELVQALQNGEERAFGILIDQYHSRLLRLAKTFAPNLFIAEEIVQDTWVDVLEGIGEFGRQVTLKSWIFMTLYNKMRQFPEVSFASLSSIDRSRSVPLKTQTHDHRIIPDNTCQPFKDTQSSSGSVPHLPPPNFKQRIEQVFASLTPIQRQVVILRDFEQFTPCEVCDILRFSENTFLTELHITRTMLNAKIYLTPEA